MRLSTLIASSMLASLLALSMSSLHASEIPVAAAQVSEAETCAQLFLSLKLSYLNAVEHARIIRLKASSNMTNAFERIRSKSNTPEENARDHEEIEFWCLHQERADEAVTKTRTELQQFCDTHPSFTMIDCDDE